MSKRKIKPWGNKIQLDFPTTKAGAIVVDTGYSIQEIGTIVAFGPAANRSFESWKPILKPGDQLLIKTWDVDIITLEDEKFYFISEDSRAICAVVS